MKLSPRMLAATIAATMFTSGLVMTGEADARHYRRGSYQPEVMYDALSPEKQTLYDSIMKNFTDRVSSLQEKMQAKRIELNTLSRSPNVDTEAIRTASRELAALQAEMDKEYAALREQINKEVGISLPFYGGRGDMYHHQGPWHGRGRCDGPGYGGYYHGGYNCRYGMMYD